MSARRVPRPVAAVGGFAAEIGATLGCAVRYPLGIAETALTTGHPSGEQVHDTPVLLVHGYGHNQSGWWALDRHLRHAGFTSVHRLNYLPMGQGIPALARRLAHRVEEVRALTGAERIHVVAHSLGGVLLRWYVQELGGDQRVHTAITLGSPHEGTLPATFAPERTAREMKPGSWVVDRLASNARPMDVKWVAYWSDADMLIQPHTAARITAPALRAVNIRVRGLGHLSLMVAPRVVRSVTTQLEAAEGFGASLIGMPTAAPADDQVIVPAEGSSSITMLAAASNP